jgi:hypothetical protein
LRELDYFAVFFSRKGSNSPVSLIRGLRGLLCGLYTAGLLAIVNLRDKELWVNVYNP